MLGIVVPENKPPLPVWLLTDVIEGRPIDGVFMQSCYWLKRKKEGKLGRLEGKDKEPKCHICTIPQNHSTPIKGSSLVAQSLKT